jgi:hypothetical protein
MVEMTREADTGLADLARLIVAGIPIGAMTVTGETTKGAMIKIGETAKGDTRAIVGETGEGRMTGTSEGTVQSDRITQERSQRRVLAARPTAHVSTASTAHQSPILTTRRARKAAVPQPLQRILSIRSSRLLQVCRQASATKLTVSCISGTCHLA